MTEWEESMVIRGVTALEEIRDLLKEMSVRPIGIPPGSVSFPAMDGSCFVCGGKHAGLVCPVGSPIICATPVER